MATRVAPKPRSSQYQRGSAAAGGAVGAQIPRALRTAVMRRDCYRCQRCAHQVLHTTHSLQHRDPRGMGGRAGANTPENLILLCGSGSTGCHGWAEENPVEAKASGFALAHGTDPATTPVLRFLQRWEQPTADGWVPAEAPAWAAAS